MITQDDERFLKYAWEWFSYHANQRLVAFNFFLVFVGFILIGVTKCFEIKSYLFGSIISFIGMSINVVFWFLEARNEELVNYGRDALKSVENKSEIKIYINDEERTIISDDNRVGRLIKCIIKNKEARKVIIKHAFLFRSVFLIIFVLSFGSFVYFILKLCN